MDFILYLSVTHPLAVSLAGSFSCTFLDRFLCPFYTGNLCLFYMVFLSRSWSVSLTAFLYFRMVSKGTNLVRWRKWVKIKYFKASDKTKLDNLSFDSFKTKRKKNLERDSYECYNSDSHLISIQIPALPAYPNLPRLKSSLISSYSNT